MPVISVITAVFEGGHAYLPDAYESIAAQTLPPGWAWEWVVQEDGRSGRPAAALPSDDRVRYATGGRGGAGVARTLGLARAQGQIVRALDADDLLTSGALARDIQTLIANPESGWCISACLDLLPDGSFAAGPYDPPPGRLEGAWLREQYERDQFPVVSTHLTARTPLVRALGGWPALPALEALALVLACSAVSSGRMIAEPGGIYRKHADQTTAQPDYHREAEFAAMRRSILTRLDALAMSGWRYSTEKDALQ
ncbi:glycosyltransferase [[Kitasatospora] papulosa]|uniref:glycosyltransferase n=1 Tax=[Kitasatospora] papulosa TaxID=1464011 RepID=UPI0005715F04|nr:glycosyltransferase [[Kitasatospora] papulosa]